MSSQPQEAWQGILESPPGAEVTIDGRRFLYFAGTAYLALQGDSAVIEAGCEALRRYGVHTATSRGGYGTSPPVQQVEALAAQYFGTDAAFYFATGYWGPALTLAALGSRYEAIFYDEQSHYSFLEAAKLSGQFAFPFAHCSASDLSAQLERHLPAGGRPLVITDGVFASSGRIAPFPEYRQVLAAWPGALLALDDAHAVGVLGEGRGTLAHFGVDMSEVNHTPEQPAETNGPSLYCCATLSKALGGHGGIITGNAGWIERIKASLKYFAGASSPAAAVAGSSAAALELVILQPDLRTRLFRNVRLLREGLRNLRLPVEDSPVPFLSLAGNDAVCMQAIQRQLRDRGVIIAYFRSYSGIGEQGHLRIAVSAAHTPAMIDRLVEQLRDVLAEVPLASA